MVTSSDPYAAYANPVREEKTPKQRATEANIEQSGASTRSSEASAKRTNVLLPGEVTLQQKGIEKAEAELREARAKADAAEKAAGAAKQKAAVVRAQMLGAIRQYRKDIKGQPATRGFGLFEGLANEPTAGVIPAYPAFEAFDASNNAILPLIRPLVAQSSKEGDSDKEMAIFMSYIPTADDTDATIENKYRMLDMLIGGLGEGRPPSEIIMSGSKPRSIDQIETSILKDAETMAKQERAGLSVMPEPGVDVSAPLPGRSNEPELETVAPGETMGVSDVNRAYAARMQAAFDSNASYEDIQALAQKLYGAPLDEKQLKAGIEYRNRFLQEGGAGPSGVIMTPPETPLTTEQLSNVQELNSADKALLAKAGMAATAGQAANIAGLFDPAEAERIRLSQDIYSEASPLASLGGTVAGSIVPTALGAFGLTRLGAAPELAAYIADIGYGGVTGAGENPENPWLGATTGAGVSALGTLAGRYVGAPLIEKGTRAAVKGMQLLPGKAAELVEKYLPEQLKNVANKPTFGQRILAEKLGDPTSIEQQLLDAERLNLPVGLADVSTPAQTYARQVARRAPEAAEQADADILARGTSRIDRIKQAITDFVANPLPDVRAAEAAIEEAADDAAGPLYTRALNKPAPVDDKIDNMLNTTIGRKGLKRAYEYAESRGVDPTSLGFTLNDMGEVVLARRPSWDTLHYIRRGLQRELDSNRDPVTRTLDLKNPDVDNASNFLKRFDKRLDALNPDYGAARAAWAQYIAPRDYLQLGLKAAAHEVPPADVQRTLARIASMPETTAEEQALKQQALEAYRQGFATSQTAAVETARSAGKDPYGLIFGTPRQQQKLDLIAPGAADFAKSAELEARMAATESILKPSIPAQGRAEAEAGLTGADIAGAIGDTLLTGTPLLSSANLVRNAMQKPGVQGWLADTLKLGAPFRAGERSRELAPSLLGAEPRAALDAFQQARGVVDAYREAQRPIRVAGIYGGGVGASAGATEANRPPEYAVAPQPLSQDTLLVVTYGPGVKLNPDGSVTKKDGSVVPAEMVKKDVAANASLLTPYYGGQ